jgi:hypothetical protein
VNRPLLVVLIVLCVTSAGPAAAATRLPGFRSPSGNIGCFFVPGKPATVVCKIAHADYAKRLEARCAAPPIELDWAGFTLPAGTKGRVSCSGGILYDPNTQRPSYVTLPYGKLWTHKMFDCRSLVSGVNCSNHHGHGLFLSRQTWRTW